MASSSNQKLKLLYLLKILLEKTDAQNPMTMAEIISALARHGIQAERKSLYSDMELLRQFGVDVEMQRSKTVGYYVAERQFELPELKLLVDAVQSCRFISKRKSEKLIKKLSSLTSSHQAKQLHRQVFVMDRAKTINETVYYSIDQIHHAIGEGKKIAFQYFDYDVRKKRSFRRHGKLYITTPVNLCWNNDNYYLIAYSAKYDDFTHYRVDRMSNVDVLSEDGDKLDKDKFNISEHAKRAFGMFDGELVEARLAFDHSLVNVVLDHFGKDVLLLPSTDGWFEISVPVSVSPVFLAWIFQFGDYVEIKEPDSLIFAMRELAEISMRRYLTE